jgi:hypothetical protein
MEAFAEVRYSRFARRPGLRMQMPQTETTQRRAERGPDDALNACGQ